MPREGMKPKPSRYFAFLRGCQLWGGREYEDREEGEIEDKDGHEADMPELGHGGEGTELVPRMIQTLAGKEVIGAAAGGNHTAAWTEEGELFTFGAGHSGRLGHGGDQHESLPRLVEALLKE